MTEIPDLLEVDPAHREDLEALMDLLRVAVQLESRCDYGDAPGDGERRSSFLAHFGELSEPLEQWNAGVDRVEAAPGALWGWLARTTIDRGVSEPPFAIGAMIDRLAILTAARARQGLLEAPHRLFLEHFKDRLGGGEGVSMYVEGQNVRAPPQRAGADARRAYQGGRGDDSGAVRRRPEVRRGGGDSWRPGRADRPQAAAARSARAARGDRRDPVRPRLPDLRAQAPGAGRHP